MLPRIVTSPTAVGFHWADPAGVPRRLLDLFGEPGAEPHRWVPTHLEALDDVLVDLTGRCGEVLGGGRPPSPEEVVILRRGYREIDRLTVEYDDARRAAGLPEATRAGQIVRTAALLSVHARTRLGLMGPVPFDGELDAPPPGVVGGRAGLHWVDPAHPWLGARWLVVTDPAPGEPPARLPASLSMLLTDSSGVDPVASRREHREALGQVTAAVGDKGAATTDRGATTVAARRREPRSAGVSSRSRRPAPSTGSSTTGSWRTVTARTARPSRCRAIRRIPPGRWPTRSSSSRPPRPRRVFGRASTRVSSTSPRPSSDDESPATDMRGGAFAMRTIVECDYCELSPTRSSACCCAWSTWPANLPPVFSSTASPARSMPWSDTCSILSPCSPASCLALSASPSVELAHVLLLRIDGSFSGAIPIACRVRRLLGQGSDVGSRCHLAHEG